MGRPARTGAILVVVVLASIQFVQDVRNGSGVIDFTTDYVTARDWREGREAYAPIWGLDLDGEVVRRDARNPHTPFYVLLVAPFSFLPYESARLVWLALSAFLLAGAMGVYLRARGLPAWWGLAVLALPLTHYDLVYGNASGLMVAILVGAWWAHRFERDRTAGLLIGVAVAMKFFPILLVPFLWRRGFHRMTGWLIGGAAGFSLVGVAALGWDESVVWFREATPSNLSVWAGHYLNASLVSYPVRLFGWTPLLGLAVGAAAALLAWRYARGYWQAVSWSVLGSTIAWPHYALLALPRLVDLPIRFAGLIVILLSVAIFWTPAATLALLGCAFASGPRPVEPARGPSPTG